MKIWIAACLASVLALVGAVVGHEAADFRYRINRRRDSATLQDSYINRLSTWKVNMYMMTVISPNQLEPVPTPTTYALALELDINTPGDRNGQLPQDLIPAISDELIEFAESVGKLEFISNKYKGEFQPWLNEYENKMLKLKTLCEKLKAGQTISQTLLIDLGL